MATPPPSPHPPVAKLRTIVLFWPVPDPEPGERAGFVLRARKGNSGAGPVGVNDGIGSDVRVERVRAAEDNLLAVEPDVPSVRLLGDDDRMLIIAES